MRAAAIFLALSCVFLVVTLVDVSRKGRGWNPARRTWLRLAAIFALVSFLIWVLQ